MDQEFSFKTSLWEKALSYLAPVSISRQTGGINPQLEFFLYRNQWQLVSQDALYSDGTRYMPFKIAFKEIGKSHLSGRSECLILGCGLGSNVQLLAGKYDCKAHYTLVDLDEQILSWCQKLLLQKGIKNITACWKDAGHFLLNDLACYDLICIDVFVNKTVPPFFISSAFFNAVKRRLASDGLWIMNYMKDNEGKYNGFRSNIGSVFTTVHCLKNRENIILWGTNTE